MSNEEKTEKTWQWIDPEEWIMVHFRGAQGLHADVTLCNAELVDLSIERRVPYLTQGISIPLSRTEVSKDLSH